MGSVSPDSRLIEAVDSDSYDGVRAAVANGADINLRGAHGETPLIKAILCDDPRIFRFLLESGADVNISTLNGYSPLTFACLQNNFEYVRSLLSYPVDLSAKTEEPLLFVPSSRVLALLRVIVSVKLFAHLNE